MSSARSDRGAYVRLIGPQRDCCFVGHPVLRPTQRWPAALSAVALLSVAIAAVCWLERGNLTQSSKLRASDVKATLKLQSVAQQSSDATLYAAPYASPSAAATTSDEDEFAAAYAKALQKSQAGPVAPALVEPEIVTPSPGSERTAIISVPASAPAYAPVPTPAPTSSPTYALHSDGYSEVAATTTIVNVPAFSPSASETGYAPAPPYSSLGNSFPGMVPPSPYPGPGGWQSGAFASMTSTTTINVPTFAPATYAPAPATASFTFPPTLSPYTRPGGGSTQPHTAVPTPEAGTIKTTSKAAYTPTPAPATFSTKFPYFRPVSTKPHTDKPSPFPKSTVAWITTTTLAPFATHVWPRVHPTTTAAPTTTVAPTTTGTTTKLTTETSTITTKLGRKDLYCWSMMLPYGSELALMKAQVQHGVGITACDTYDIFSEGDIELSPGPPVRVGTVDVGSLKCDFGGKWHLALNSKVFIKVWKKIFALGEYLNAKWTVKVDPDAVFIPGRLRKQVAHGDPDGNVYLNNCDQGLHGPIEVIAAGGMEVFKAGIGRCEKELNYEFGKWGEDVFLRHCLGKLKVNRVDNFRLLSEDRCLWENPAKTGCTSGKVSFHPFKKPDAYMRCLDEAGVHVS